MRPVDGFARLPTYTEVFDGMANGLGLVRNREDYLIQLAQYDKRADVYSGVRGPGLVEKLLSLFCGGNTTFQTQMRDALADLEQYMSELRSQPLHTNASYHEGFAAFLEYVILPWTAQSLLLGRYFQGSPAWHAGAIIQEAARSKSTVLEAWKRQIRALLPPDMKVTEFRKAISKATSTSPRKNEGIEIDIKRLETEISHFHLADKQAFLEAVRSSYIAGMSLTRCIRAAKPYIDEAQLIGALIELITADNSPIDPQKEIEAAVGHTEPPAIFSAAIFGEGWDEPLLDAALSQARELSSFPEMCHYLPALLAYKHISRDERGPAMKELQTVVDATNGRQIGQVAEWAATMLIALHLHTSPPKTHLALNPLVKVRIDNLRQRLGIQALAIPTPFSMYSQAPEIDTYDLHMLESINLFISHPRAPGVQVPFLYLERIDRLFQSLLEAVSAPGSRPVGWDSTKLVLPGISVPTYELIRDLSVYQGYIHARYAPEMNSLNQYLWSSEADQKRVLRLVDPVSFRRDVERYG